MTSVIIQQPAEPGKYTEQPEAPCILPHDRVALHQATPTATLEQPDRPFYRALRAGSPCCGGLWREALGRKTSSRGLKYDDAQGNERRWFSVPALHTATKMVHPMYPCNRISLDGCSLGPQHPQGPGFPSFVGPFGLAHSHALGEFLRERYNVPEDPEADTPKLNFWSELQRRGYTLKSLYEEIERELSATRPHLISDFQAIIRAAVSAPMKDRGISNVCRYHRAIVEALDPGDYIIDFNWDCLMADALLHFSHLWFPATGFGTQVWLMLPRCQKDCRN